MGKAQALTGFLESAEGDYQGGNNKTNVLFRRLRLRRNGVIYKSQRNKPFVTLKDSSVFKERVVCYLSRRDGKPLRVFPPVGMYMILPDSACALPLVFRPFIKTSL